jgi:hypothetical protein
MKHEKAMDLAIRQRLLDVHERVLANFNAGHWETLGVLTGMSDLIDNHSRLLRSLSWGDEDYSGNALAVLRQMIERAPRTLPVIESFLDDKFPGEAQYISAKPSERKITFAPYVFAVPDGYVELDLASTMMPFTMEFRPIHEAIKRACQANKLRCLRADDIWEESTIIQDIFNLVFRSQVIIVDFTGKNPNVMYETGIAHTLGKHVIPITQSLDDVPFDMRHHRTLKYLPNAEGLKALESALGRKLSQFKVGAPPPIEPSVKAQPDPFDDDIPF